MSYVGDDQYMETDYVKPLTGIPHRRGNLRRAYHLKGLRVEAQKTIFAVGWYRSSEHNGSQKRDGGCQVKARHAWGLGTRGEWEDIAIVTRPGGVYTYNVWP